jgi:catechol 2,3-dioxygenase-like lactoylglutathione lyase family enzyme
MPATGLNHVSVSAVDLEESARFYSTLFGMERIPTPNFRHPVLWLRLGDQQLHLFQRETDPPPYHHLGINVDDFEAVYAKAHELGAVEGETWYSHAYELADGSVQFYLRDPAGNLVEVDWPDASTLDREVVTDLKKLDDEVPQTGEALRATLFHTLRAHAPT